MLRNVVEATGRCVVHEAQVAKARTEDCPNMCAGVFADAVKQLQYFLYNDKAVNNTLSHAQKLSRDDSGIDSGPEKKSRLSDPFSCRRTSQRLALELWLPPTSNQRPNRGAPIS